jgi:hypothetical protein
VRRERVSIIPGVPTHVINVVSNQIQGSGFEGLFNDGSRDFNVFVGSRHGSLQTFKDRTTQSGQYRSLMQYMLGGNTHGLSTAVKRLRIETWKENGNL